MPPTRRGSARSAPGGWSPSPLVQLQDRKEGLLGPLDAAYLFHPPLPGLLLLEQLALPRHVAAVQLRGHVLAQRLDRLAREHPRSDRRLDRDVEELPRDRLLEPLDEPLAGGVRLVAVDDYRQRVDAVAGEEHVELDEVGGAHPDRLGVERRVSARLRLEQIVEVEHDLGHWELVGELDT